MNLPAEFVWSLDVVIRVSLVLAIALLVAACATRNAALRHAVLLAGLGTGLLLPLAMAAVHALPALQERLDWLAWMAPPANALRFVAEGGPLEVAAHELLRPPAPHDLLPKGDEDHSPTVSSPESPGDGSPRWTRRLTGALMFVVLLVTFARIAGLGWSLLRLRQLVARATPVEDERTLTLLAALETRFATRRPVHVLESAGVSVPVAAGVAGPYIVLPRGWSASLEPSELQSVLRHEWAHLLRRDHWVVLAQELLAALFWFNPVVHCFNRALARVREEVCDNYALDAVDRLTYCETLLRLATCAARAPQGAVPMWTSDWSLEERVQGILDERRTTHNALSRGARWGAGVAAVLLGCVVAAPMTGTARSVDARRWPQHMGVNHSALNDGPTLVHKMLRRSFSPKPGVPLRLENLAGRVELVAGAGPSIEVTAAVRVGDLPPDEARALLDEIEWVEGSADEGAAAWGLKLPTSYARIRYPVEEEVKAREQTADYLGRPVGIVDYPLMGIPSWEADLRIAVPAGASLELHNAVGPVEGAALPAALRLTTVAGCIQIRNVTAPLIASSDCGDIMIHNSQADLELRTNTGNIDLSHTEAGRIVVKSRLGGCRILRPASSFRVRSLGPKPLAVFDAGVVRLTEVVDGRRIESVSRGFMGPEFEIKLAAAECTIEAARK